MKDNKIHICFVIDESGSMWESRNDVVGGFNRMIEEQKALDKGECIVSLYKFSDEASEVFVGRDVKDVEKLEATAELTELFVSNSGAINAINLSAFDLLQSRITSEETPKKKKNGYYPSGLTAMNDGIGLAIDNVGKWLAAMPEEERPSKNVVVIMTDGEENYSHEYTLGKVQEMIKHQTEKYSWEFIYMGCDITKNTAAKDLGIKNRSYSSKSSDDTFKNYSNISAAAFLYRCADTVVSANAAFDASLKVSLDEMTKSYEAKTGIKIED